MYEYIDENIEVKNAKVRKQFKNTRLQLQKYDALNNIMASSNNRQYVNIVRNKISALYRRLISDNEYFFKQVATSSVIALNKAETSKEADEYLALIGFSLAPFLERYNQTLLYVYQNEVERKRDRFTEGVIAIENLTSKDMDDFVKRNQNQWNGMTEEIAVDIERQVKIDSIMYDGYSKGIWVTMGDEKVCKECRELDGYVFDLSNAPSRPHPHCRCEIKLYRE